MSASEKRRLQLLSEAKPDSWIALSSDETRVVGTGATYAEAVEDATRNGESDPGLIKIPSDWSPLVLFANRL